MPLLPGVIDDRQCAPRLPHQGVTRGRAPGEEDCRSGAAHAAGCHVASLPSAAERSGAAGGHRLHGSAIIIAGRWAKARSVSSTAALAPAKKHPPASCGWRGIAYTFRVSPSSGQMVCVKVIAVPRQIKLMRPASCAPYVCKVPLVEKLGLASAINPTKNGRWRR